MGRQLYNRTKWSNNDFDYDDEKTNQKIFDVTEQKLIKGNRSWTTKDMGGKFF